MSRDTILKSISANRPDNISLPKTIDNWDNEFKDLTIKFIELAKSAGSEIVEMDSMGSVKDWINQQKSSGEDVLDLTQMARKQAEQMLNENEFNSSDIIVLRGQFGVAENGAVWINEQDMQIRKFPFIANHLVLLLDKKNFLADMHQAYDQIDLNKTDFGVFIAGPSKTADIEQSLVIGAHGSIKHTILIIDRYQ